MRPDISFNEPIDKWNVNFDKVNLTCMFIPDMNSDDNLFFFKREWYPVIEKCGYEILHDRSNSHQYYKYLEKYGLSCHYLGGETSKRDGEFDVIFRLTRGELCKRLK